MKTAGVRDLKAHLSSYLRDVAAGEVVLVTDRGRVVAEMRAPGAAELTSTPAELRYRRLIESGRLRPGTRPDMREWPPPPSVKLPMGTAAALLDAGREER